MGTLPLPASPEDGELTLLLWLWAFLRQTRAMRVWLESQELRVGLGFLPGFPRATEAGDAAEQSQQQPDHRPSRWTRDWAASGSGGGKRGAFGECP